MHLGLLVESESIDPSDNSLKFDVNLEITTTQSIKFQYSKDVAKEYLKNLDIEEVKDLASDSSPIVVDFYECMHDNKMEDFLPIQRRFYHYLMADAIESSSKKYKYFEELLSLGERYTESLNSFKKFLSSVLSENDLILKKIAAIYDKFGGSSSKDLKAIFTLYSEYSKNPSNDLKRSILKEYWANKSNIDYIVDEMYSISGQIFKKNADKVSKDEQQQRNAQILEYLKQNETELKHLSEKLLYVEYLKELFERAGLHHKIDLNQIKQFADKTKRPTTDNIIKSVVANNFPYNSEITKTGNKTKISLHAVTYSKLSSFIDDLYENGKFTIDVEIIVKSPASKFGTPYKLLYSMKSVNGVNHLYKIINELYNMHGSSNKVLSEMAIAPEDAGKHYKKLSMKLDDNALKFNAFVHSPQSFKEQLSQRMQILENAKNLNEEEYNNFLSESLEKLANKENPNISLKDALRDIDEDDLTVHSYKVISEEFKNPNSKYISYISNRIGKKVFSLVMSGKSIEKYMKNLFVLAVKNDQDEILDAVKFVQPSNINQAINLAEFLDTYNELFVNKESFIDGFTLVLNRYLSDPHYYANYSEYLIKLKQILDILKKYDKKDKLLMDVDSMLNKENDE